MTAYADDCAVCFFFNQTRSFLIFWSINLIFRDFLSFQALFGAIFILLFLNFKVINLTSLNSLFSIILV